MNLEHKAFKGWVEYDDLNENYFTRVKWLEENIYIHAETIVELEEKFKEVIDKYLEKNLDKEEIMFKMNIPLRISYPKYLRVLKYLEENNTTLEEGVSWIINFFFT